MEIFNQLGELFLAAVPTVIFVFIFYIFLRWSFFTPIERVLGERHKRAEGARREAEASRAAVQEKLRGYHEALRKARGELFSAQEALRRGVIEERQREIQAARLAAQADLQAAKMSLVMDVEAAQMQLEESSGALAAEIADAILTGSSSPARGGTR